MLDSYEKLIPGYISKEDFFRFGLEQTLYIPDSNIKKGWDDLLKKIKGNKTLYIRGVKEANQNHLFFDFNKMVFGNAHTTKDPSNSQSTTKIMDALSGYKKSKDLKNYQMSTIFGKSRNIFLFNAPWNLAYVPKIMEPFLSVDNNSELAKEFKALFLEQGKKKFKSYIKEYNELVTNRHFVQQREDYIEQMYDNAYLDHGVMTKFEDSLREELSPIEI